MKGAASAFVFHKKADDPFCQMSGHFLQGKPDTRSRRVFHQETFTVKFAELPDRLDDKVIDGYPYGAPPIGIAAKKIRCGITRIVFDIIVDPSDIDGIR